MSKFSTDAIRPSALPSASLGRRGGDTALSGNSEKEALEKEYQAWNVRIDTEVKSLSSGLKELVQLANVRRRDSSRAYHMSILVGSLACSATTFLLLGLEISSLPTSKIDLPTVPTPPVTS